jgi:hypothetical protein
MLCSIFVTATLSRILSTPTDGVAYNDNFSTPLVMAEISWKTGPDMLFRVLIVQLTVVFSPAGGV